MSLNTFQETLESLQCQFTWDFEAKEKINADHILQTVEIKIQHTAYENLSTLYNLKAFLLQSQQRSLEALQCLKKAEEIVRRDHVSTIDQRILATYGNYAWIYYHLEDYKKVETYLNEIREICLKLQSDSDYCVESAEMYAEQGWSMWAAGMRNGDHAKMCFEKALEKYPNDKNLRAGLAYSTYARTWYYSDDDVVDEAINPLEEIVRSDTGNWEARVYLATVLQNSNQDERAQTLVNNNLPDCCNPEVLRKLAKLFIFTDGQRFIDILHRALAIAPHYHLLYEDVGKYYMDQVFIIPRSEPERRAHNIALAIRAFTKAIELMPSSVYSRISLANMYGENNQVDYQEMLYKKMESQLPEMAESCQQDFYFNYGNFNLYKKRQLEKAAELYKKGFQINPQHKWGVKCRERLERMASEYGKRGDITRKNEIYRFLQENNPMT